MSAEEFVRDVLITRRRPVSFGRLVELGVPRFTPEAVRSAAVCLITRGDARLTQSLQVVRA